MDGARQFLGEASVTFVQCPAMDTVIGKFVFNVSYLRIDAYL
jgi:hypothetical protein